jgi:hypothetical protein
MPHYDLFSDGAISAQIQRKGPRQRLPHASMCFNPECANEASPDGLVIVLRARAARMAMAGCPSCSQLHDNAVLALVREATRQHFGLGATPRAGFVDTVDMSCCTVEGIELAIVNGVDCPPAYAFVELLAARLLPKFAFAFDSVGNCFTIVHHLMDDFAALGLDGPVAKVGRSTRICANGKPWGPHAWIEWDGFIIDAANGGAGKPVTFERAEDYLTRHQFGEIAPFTKGQVEAMKKGD